MVEDEQATWEAALQCVIAEGGIIERVVVTSEVDSTQDEARRRRLAPGTLLTALRQTSGRGRVGRSWHDTESDGVALTFVLEDSEPGLLSLRSAIAGARALEAVAPVRVGIKWPNDLYLSSRKVGGVLVEIADRLAYAGVGINVSQTRWPAHLAGRAISLLEAGYAADRLAVTEAMLRSINTTWLERDEELMTEFASRDVLTGRVATVEHDRAVYTGRVLAIDPVSALTLQGPAGAFTLPAATTRIRSVENME